jgi:uncharacterized Zn finger protein (UPF0148 family)
MGKVKQPEHCDECGTALTEGECGKGWCAQCKTYIMRIHIDQIKGAYRK